MACSMPGWTVLKNLVSIGMINVRHCQSFEFVKCKEPFFKSFFKKVTGSKWSILANFSQFLPNWPRVGNYLEAQKQGIGGTVIVRMLR